MHNSRKVYGMTEKYIKSAFTMLELIFVIIVVGILVSIALPRMDRDTRQEAAENILSDINHARHMALTDYIRSDNGKWQKGYWRIEFGKCANSDNYYEAVGADKRDHDGALDQDEAAIDPANGRLMWTWNNDPACNIGGNTNVTSGRIFLTKKYGIKNIVGCNNKKYIGFDHMGRTFVGFRGDANNNPLFVGYQANTCTFTFTMSNDETFQIFIEPDTGYAEIIYD